MDDISAVALFCADIREERGGTATIVGVMPDTLNVPRMPGGLPKLCAYVRMHVGVNFDPGALFTRIVLNGEEISRGDVESELFEKTRDEAKAIGKEFAGLISTFVMSPFVVTKEGRVEALVTAAGKERLVGTLALRLSKPNPT